MWKKEKARFSGKFASPWLIIGAAAVLAAVVAVLAYYNYNREVLLMTRTLSEKGGVFIKAFEAGARSGERGRGEGAEVQALLEELAQYPDVLYLVITDETGRIVAHNNRLRIGESFVAGREMADLAPSTEEKWRVSTTADGRRVFEVYKVFIPLIERRPISETPGCNRNRRGWCAGRMRWPQGRRAYGAGRGADEPVRAAIFVGLDMAPFEEARQADARLMMVLATVLVLLGLGGLVSLFWAHNYRTSRRQMLDARALASEVIGALPVGLIVTDPDGRAAFVNEAGGRILGVEEADLRGRPLEEVAPVELAAIRTRVKQGETVVEEEMELHFPDGRTAPVSVSASRIVTEEGRLVGCQYILRNLSEIRRLQAEVRRREKLAAIGDLAAGVAHEIRNPLSSIKGYAVYFGGRFEEGSEDRKAAEVMVGEVDRLNRVITELLEFARPSDVKPRPTDVNELVDQALRLIRQDAAAKDIETTTEHAPHTPLAPVDPDRLTQALLNILTNAVQAMEEGGRLTVRVKSDDHAGVRIEVEDTGRGIQPEDVSQVFNPYFTTKAKGAGLGLAIVHKIVEAHGGRVKVASRPGRGSRFTIILPGENQPPAPEEDAHEAQRADR
jgi:two-component system sensor histidine kinase HydH